MRSSTLVLERGPGVGASGPQGVHVRSRLEAPLGSTLRHDTRCSTSNRPARTVSRGIEGGAPEEVGLDRSATEGIRCSRVHVRSRSPERSFSRSPSPWRRARLGERARVQSVLVEEPRETDIEGVAAHRVATRPGELGHSTSSAVRTRTEPDGSRTWSFDEGRSDAGVSWERGSSREASRGGRPGWGRAPRGKVKVGLRKASTSASLPARRTRAGPAAPGRDERHPRPALPHVAHRSGSSAPGRWARRCRREAVSVTKTCALGASTGSRVCRRSQDFISDAPASSTPCGARGGRLEARRSPPTRIGAAASGR